MQGMEDRGGPREVGVPAAGQELVVDPSQILAWLKERAARYRAAGSPAGETADAVIGVEELGLFGVLLRGSFDGIVLSDSDSEWILAVSDSFEAMSGYSRNELVGRTSLELELVRDDEVHRRSVAQARAGLEGMYETTLRRKDGTLRWVEFSQQLIGDNFVLTIVRDSTERKRLEEGLRALAEYDELTAIFNRRRFQEEVERHLREAKRFGDPLTLLLIDIDGFKRINDTYGHQTGDKALQVVADALRHAVRETDLVGRLGGDEFVALLTRADPRGVDRVVEVFRRSLRLEDEATGASFGLEASVGVTVSDGVLDTFDTLLRRADRAMYEEKARKNAD
jgi:diguanylate cyclase (GGDEF)-like protein/PAS domain S-box-containing protein